MSSDTPPQTAIRVEGISKRYHLGGRAPYRLLTDAVTRAITRPFRSGEKREPKEQFYALKDVSFSVNEGEILGIVGANGSGKTTLLMVLSRITRPTAGRAEVHGRVGSLLEVGTGFHPELSGRENVFLNGAILGMTRREVTAKYEEIVTFSQMEEFMDTPVKHYSTGMRVRLAFSVAAHLEPEILFIDEVLAVGDAAFQAKCLGKMDEVAKSGRTVLFVSHNMGMVTSLCSRAIWLQHGRVRLDASPTDVVEAYLSHGMSAEGRWTHPTDERCGEQVRIDSVSIVGPDGELRPDVPFEEPVRLQVEVVVRESTHGLRTIVHINDVTGNLLLATSNLDVDPTPNEWHPGRYRLAVELPAALLQSKRYVVSAFARTFAKPLDAHERCVGFQVIPPGASGSARRSGRAAIAPNLTWSAERVEAPD